MELSVFQGWGYPPSPLTPPKRGVSGGDTPEMAKNGYFGQNPQNGGSGVYTVYTMCARCGDVLHQKIHTFVYFSVKHTHAKTRVV